MEVTPSPSRPPTTETVVVAETVFLLLTKEHRISKHLRAKWYLKHVNTIMEFPYYEENPGHPQVVSVLVNGNEPLKPAPDGSPVKFKLATNTAVNFLCSHHDLVFAIDVSFSAISGSTADSEVLFDTMHQSLRKTIVGLTKTFIIPGTEDKMFIPYIYATVIAYCPLENCPTHQVLTHGYLISHHNVDEFIKYISLELNRFENGVAEYMKNISEACRSRKSSITSIHPSLLGDDFESDEVSGSLKDQHLSPEKGFFHLLKNALLAIHLLPSNCSSGIIVITDGNVGIGDVGRYDNLLVQLLSQSCTCSVIEVQCLHNEKRGLGRVPHSELLQFIATATFGAYFSDTEDMSSDVSQKMNKYHKGVLSWDFKKSIQDLQKIGPTVESLTYEKKMKRRYTGYQLTVPINCVITTRLKEGFTIKAVDASKENFIEVIMVLPWRKNIRIEYKAGSIWPVPATSPITHIEIYYEGNYHFLHDLICKKAHIHTNTVRNYRNILVGRFWKSLLSLKTIDDSLVMMQSFHTEEEFSSIPDSIKKGVALFCSTIDSKQTRTLDIISHNKDTDVEQFANYWKRVLCIDLGVPLDKSGLTFERSSHVMEKWFHITKLHMVLEHDPKHPESLNIPFAQDRYHSLQVRQAYQSLTKLLRDWNDFELLENSHYVKYIHRQEHDTTPISGYHDENWLSFCMIMLSIKDACVTLRLTFLGGTDSIYRTRMITDLKGVLQALYFPKSISKVRNKKTVEDEEGLTPGVAHRKPPLQRHYDERPCVNLMTKPLDRVLVRYERIPEKILTVDNINRDISPLQGVPSRLANYLHHQRWVWYLQPTAENAHFEALDMKTIGSILNVITSIRLQEGFHFSHTNSGIVSMILQVDMTNVPEGSASLVPPEDQGSLSALVQYVTFPPQRRTKIHDCVSESEVDEEAADSIGSGELTMITEVWIEPQHGFVTNSTPERSDYDGCTFSQWPDRLFPVDEKCITLLVTLEHLLKYCSPVSRTSMSSSLVSGRLERFSSDCGAKASAESVKRVKQVPFSFSVIELLPRCQQIEMLLPTYCPPTDESPTATPRSSDYYRDNHRANEILLSHLFDALEKHPDSYEMELTGEECAKFMAQVQGRDRDPSVEPLCFKAPTVPPEFTAPSQTDASPAVNNSSHSTRGLTKEQNQGGSFTDRTTASSQQYRDDRSQADDFASWKCYCFSAASPPGTTRDTRDGRSNEAVTVLFIPASFKSLMEMGHCKEDDDLTDKKYQTDDTTDDSNYMTSSDREIHLATPVPPLKLSTSPQPPGSPPSHTTSSGSRDCTILPVYLYHCPRKQLVESLVNGDTNNLKPDECIDLRFVSDEASGREYRTSYRSDRSDESEALLSQAMSNRRRFRTESTCSKRSLSRAASMDQSAETSASDISAFCEEMFFKSYITGIFRSLQKNYKISSHDIESAIDICTETAIYEIQLTDFLKHVCSHMTYQPAAENYPDQVFTDNVPTTPKSVKFEMPDLTSTSRPEQNSESSNTKQKRSSGSSDTGNRPSNLRSPLTVRIPCSALFERSCDTKVSPERIKAKFNEVIGKWFKPIPSCKDVYFYSPPELKHQLSENPDTNEYDTEEVEMFETGDEYGPTTPEVDIRQRLDHRLFSTSASLQSTRGSTSADLTKPLFVHLTASIRNERINLQVRDIPVCLCELQEGFKKREFIDLHHADITLDIICLTLPKEEDIEDIIAEHNEDTHPSTSDTTLSSHINAAHEDIEEALSEVQIRDITECKRGVEWLVRDEIAAAMRSTGPITEDTLKMVADHVKNGINESSCKHTSETLNYVFGAEQSHPMFLEEFKRMNVTGYQLIAKGDYYYLSIDRARLRTSSVRPDILNQLGDVAHLLDEMKVIGDHPAFTPLSQSESAASRAFDRSIEIIPGGRESLRISLARASSLPGPELHSVDWPPNFQRTRSSSKVKETASDAESSDSVAVIEDESTGPIPISGTRLANFNNDYDEEEDVRSSLQETLSSLPQRNQIDEWNREEEDFASKCGSLPKAFSSSNVNVEANQERRMIQRVSSEPQKFDTSAACGKTKIRHVSEDTGRKRATFADSVTSPPSNNSHLMTMRECSELEAARSRNPSGPWTPGSNRINGSTGSEDEASSDPGYEADFSDDEGTGGGVSLIESTRSPQMPDFWLILQVHSERGGNSSNDTKELSSHRLGQADIDNGYRVDVFFHTSESSQQERHFSDSVDGNVPKSKLFSHVVSEIRRTCKLVNQRLLLQDLQIKRRCDPLLEEDWDDDTFSNDTKRKPHSSDSDGEAEQRPVDKYLYARTKFKQGHFRCDKQWEHVFSLHPRLKTGKNKLSTRGVSALKTALGNWAVVKQPNMFVWKENHTENIFYFRLSECGDASSCVSSKPYTQHQESVVDDSRSSVSAIQDATPYLSRSSSVRSMTRLKDESDNSRRASITGDNDDTPSMSGRLTLTRRPPQPEDGVKLSVYGIDQPGSEIKEHLVKMLSGKLEKQVLNEIEMLLSRNPNCMLTPHDVSFLQKKELPTDPLKLTLPDEVLHYQTAVLHYLRQNLLQLECLFHPKYQTPDHKFMDYTVSIDNASPMTDNDTFLYNKPHNATLALIYLQIVDSSDQPKTLLDCPKPDVESWRNFNTDIFNRLTHVRKVPKDTTTQAMSTSSYIKFSIWCTGEIDRACLDELLMKALRHALCDFVCEYYAFTAPLCEVPHDLMSELASIQHEESIGSLSNTRGNTTPTGMRSAAAISGNKHQLLSKSKSTSTSAFSFGDDHIRMKNQVSSPTLSTGDTSMDTPDMSHKKLSVSSAPPGPANPIIREIDRYKFGEKGFLLPFYTTTLVEWFEYCANLGLPALSKVSCGLLNEAIVDPIMKEFESVVRDLPGVSIQAFRLIDNKYVPYQTSRAPLAESEEASEVGLCKHLNFPYSDLAKGHVLTVRNRKLWNDSIGDNQADESQDLHTPLHGSIPRVTTKNNQKFPPAYAGMETSMSLSNSQSHSSFHAERKILPRQQFLMLAIKDGELVLYSYNLADGSDDIYHIKDSAKKIARWNNARFHLLNSVAHQKMGLFQHLSIHEMPSEKYCSDKNAYTKTFEDICHLARSSHPPSDNQKTPTQRPGSKLTKSTSQHQPGLDRIYRGCKPTRPIHLSKYGLERDPISRHGTQLIDTHKNEIRDNERKKKLEKLYNNWQQRIGPMTTEIGEDQLDLLKQSSRLVHHVATPLLLSPYWRDKAMNLPRTQEEMQKVEADRMSGSASRSRNNSGASMRSTKTSTAGIARDSPVVQFTKPYEEETWHEEMRHTFVTNYIDYLRQTQQPLEQLGFMTIKIASKPVQRGFNFHHRKHSSGGSGSEQLVRSRTTDSLQKTMPGGIFLVELSFQEVYFVVKLYVFSESQLGRSRQAQYRHLKPQAYFIEMCDRMRDNTHCHSFAHDFHLRAVHKYVKQSKDFHARYHLVKMLRDFAQYYEESPRFSRNALALKSVQLDSQNNPCDKLYQHILQHESQGRMRKITMSDDQYTDFSMENDYALAYHLNTYDTQSHNRRFGEYEVSVIICHDHPQELMKANVGKLHLAYFIVMVNKEQFPVKVPHDRALSNDNCSMDLLSHPDRLSGDSAISSSPVGYSQERRSSAQYSELLQSMDCMASNQHPAYQLLTDQCINVKDRLTSLVEGASLQCRKNSLWSLMANTTKTTRTRHYTSDVSAYYDNKCRLSFEEFQELFDQVDKHPLSCPDGLLQVLYNMSIPWFVNLTKVLASKYEHHYREFCRQDTQVIYSVVLIPEVEEAVLVLSIDCVKPDAKLLLMYLDGFDDTRCKALQECLDEFINTLCFHMWSQMAG